MRNKHDEPPAGGLWGEAAPQGRAGAIERAGERMARLPERKRRMAYAALVAAVALAFVGFAAAGAFLAAQNQSDGGKEAIREAPAGTPGEAPGAHAQKRFVDIENLTFLSEESRGAFAEQFARYLSEAGYPDASTVKVYSLVEREGPSYTAYASTSTDGQFHRISFDARSKRFAFETCDPPAGLPELANGLKAAPAPAPAAPAAPAPEEPAPAPAAPPAAANTAIMCKTTDAAELSAFLPPAAVEALPGAVVDYLASKGRAVSADACSVNLASAAVKNSNPYLEVTCTDAAGGVAVVSCEWIADRAQFGMAVL